MNRSSRRDTVVGTRFGANPQAFKELHCGDYAGFSAPAQVACKALHDGRTLLQFSS